MDFSTPRKRPRGEAILPMINVVFLLLIFFLMTARIAPRPPFAVTPPDTQADAPVEARDILFMAPDGALHYSGAPDVPALEALAQRPSDWGALTLRADADAPAKAVAKLLRELRQVGIRDVALVGRPQ